MRQNDDLPDGVGRFERIVGMLERGGEALNPAPKGFGNAGKEGGNVLRCVPQAGLLCLKLDQSIGQGTMLSSLFHDADDLGGDLRGVCKLFAGGPSWQVGAGAPIL